ncbi:RpnC/YadD family protein [Ornithinibacillus halophilus]|uniref:Essential protein Yae1, N terminal n=2 Tax=Ornithinibacillus halophilus TaxID=930117 RepID=A0A1M5P4V9_9BACI|nr:conserved hypothetical protein (putative transposase or invertase) [Ornithinibacillus halophilus]
MLELRKKNWRAFIESDNPAATALLSKMGYTDKEKVEVKMEFLKMLVRMELNPAENRFISSFFDSYLILTNEEEEVLVEKVKQLDNADEILELPNSWEKRGYRKGREEGIQQGREEGIQQGKEEGIQQGREEGKVEGKHEVVITMLKKNFPIEMISEATNVAKEEIEKMKDEM